MKTPLLLLFALVAAGQLAVPLRMVWRAEATLTHGTAVKFPLVLHDPHDPLRGKYVQLRYDWDPLALPDGLHLPPGPQRFVAHVERDAEGFGHLTGVALEPPDDGLWFRVTGWHDGNGKVHLRPDFDRYFVNEHDAAEAETAYREAAARRVAERPADPSNPVSGDGTPAPPAYAVVRLWQGEAQLEEVFVDGRPLAEIARGRRIP